MDAFDTVSKETDDLAGQSRQWWCMFNYQRIIIFKSRRL
jgi:hypothetical protein